MRMRAEMSFCRSQKIHFILLYLLCLKYRGRCNAAISELGWKLASQRAAIEREMGGYVLVYREWVFSRELLGGFEDTNATRFRNRSGGGAS